MAKYFNINGISGRVDYNRSYGKRYLITAENEFGDTFAQTTDDSEIFDYIDEEDEALEKKREEAEESVERLLTDEESWKRKATIKTYRSNATIFFGEEAKEIYYDFSADFFDSYKEAKEWIDEELEEIKDKINNYDDIKQSLMIRVCEFIKD